MPENQCPNCHIGLLHPRRVTLAKPLHSVLVTVPNVTMWVCDVCDERAYDGALMRYIELLLGIELGMPPVQSFASALPDDADELPRLPGRRGSA